MVGLMPHPEHAVEDLCGPGTDGLGFFTSVVAALQPPDDAGPVERQAIGRATGRPAVAAQRRGGDGARRREIPTARW